MNEQSIDPKHPSIGDLIIHPFCIRQPEREDGGSAGWVYVGSPERFTIGLKWARRYEPIEDEE